MNMPQKFLYMNYVLQTSKLGEAVPLDMKKVFFTKDIEEFICVVGKELFVIDLHIYLLFIVKYPSDSVKFKGILPEVNRMNIYVPNKLGHWYVGTYKDGVIYSCSKCRTVINMGDTLICKCDNFSKPRVSDNNKNNKYAL